MNNLANLVETQDQEGGLTLFDMSTSEQSQDGSENEGEEGENEIEDAIQGDYGAEEDGKGDDGSSLFEKEVDDSDVEDYMQDMEEDEMAMDGLKMPDGLKKPEDDDYGLESGEDEIEEEDDDDHTDAEHQVFADAAEHGEMNIVENMKKQLEEQEAAQKAGQGEYLNQELVGKIEQIEDEMMNPK